jgi:predicted kinase
MLFIIRGIPGSGKSTYAKNLKDAVKDDSVVHFEADMYFSKDGEYKFDPSKLKEAHGWCIEKAKEGLRQGMTVIVSNTFTRKWEMKPYIEAAEAMQLPMAVIRMENRFKNIHGVPDDVVWKMAARFEDHDGEVVLKI